MRIGLFTDTYIPEINGVVTVLQMMIRELRKEGHEVYVFYPGHPSGDGINPGVYRFSSLRFIFYKGIRMAIPYNRGAFRCIPQLDVIHSHSPGPIGLLALSASVRYHIPHVHTYHGLYMDCRNYLPRAIRPTRGMVKSVSRLLCNQCTAIIAPSDQMKNELESYGIRSPIYALPFGVDEEEFSHEIRRDFRREFNLPTEDLLLYAGRLGVEKNLDFLLRSFRRLLSLHSSARLIIAGDGPQRNSLGQYAANLGIAPYVFFTGSLKRSDLIDLYKQATLFVFASKAETQGLVVVEAMMAGIAVVAVGIMGPKDLITPSETGILVEENEGDFAQACYRLLQDEKERQRLSTAARNWARSHSSQVSTRETLEIYYRCRYGTQTKKPSQNQ
ncbi:MAG: glycosyltransferase [bacterium]|nr:glycosyltransferase [bacterium]